MAQMSQHVESIAVIIGTKSENFCWKKFENFRAHTIEDPVEPDLLIENGHQIPLKAHLSLRPFDSRFTDEFNKLPYDLRKKISEFVGNQKKADNIKSALKAHFVALYNPKGQVSQKNIEKLISANVLSKNLLEKRKSDAENQKQHRAEILKKRERKIIERSLKTPAKRRKKHSSDSITPAIFREKSKCNAPSRHMRGLKYVTQPLTPLSIPKKRVNRAGNPLNPHKRARVENVSDLELDMENTRKSIPNFSFDSSECGLYMENPIKKSGS